MKDTNVENSLELKFHKHKAQSQEYKPSPGKLQLVYLIDSIYN